MENVIIRVVAERPSFVVNLKVTNAKAKISQVVANMFKGDKGDRGERGLQGERGVGIESIIQSSSVGLVDTYIINFSDGTTTSYQVTNGKDGKSAYDYAQEGGYTGTEQDFASDLSKVDNFITNETNSLVNYTLTTETGSKLGLSINDNYLMTLQLLDKNNNVIDTKTLDFPIESMVVNASYSNGIITLVLQNGTELPINVSALVKGLVPDTRTINGKALSSDITLTASDVGALPSTTTIPTDYVSYRTSQTLTDQQKELARQNIGALSSDITIPDGVKLYDGTGNNTDGAITQKGVTDALINVSQELEEQINDNKTTIGNISNQLVAFGSSLETTQGNLADLQINVNENIQDISSLENNKANKDLSNVTYPQLTPDGEVHTESGYTTYMTTDKMTWYIIHPTGKKECGMSYTDVNNDADTTLTMPISFSDTNFVCTFSAATQNVYATIRVEKTAVNKVRIRLGSSNNAVNQQPTTGCIKCEGI